MDLTNLFKGLSDPVRFRIAHLLCQKGKLCVCQITDALSLPQSTVSRHLNTLRNCGLVEAERKGKWVYYQMKDGDDYVTAIEGLIRASLAENQQLQDDLAKLKDAPC